MKSLVEIELKIILQDDKIYQDNLRYFLDKYFDKLSLLNSTAPFLNLIRKILQFHFEFVESVNQNSKSIVHIFQDTLKSEVMSDLYKEYFSFVPRIESLLLEGFASHPEIYDYLVAARNKDKLNRSYVQLLSKPKLRLKSLSSDIKRVADDESWKDTLTAVQNLSELSEYEFVDPLATIVRICKYDVKMKKRSEDFNKKLFQAILNKIWKDEEIYVQGLHKLVFVYGDIFTTECTKDETTVVKYLSNLQKLLASHLSFRNMLERLQHFMERSVDIFHQTFCHEKFRFCQLYREYFTIVVAVSLSVIRHFSSQPDLYEKLLTKRNRDENWESYTYLMSKPKMRLRELEEDLNNIVALFNGSQRPKWIEILVSVRRELAHSNRPLQETLVNPTKEQVKRRDREIKKAGKRKLNQSVNDLDTGLSKRHRFSSLTNLNHVVGLDASNKDQKSKLKFGITR